MAPARANGTLSYFARQQHGVFTRAQALSAGLTLGAIEGRVRWAQWIAVDHGVYRAAETPTSWSQRLLAACLAGPAVASHRSAAALWGFPDFPECIVEVTAMRHRRRKSPDVQWHESVRLDPGDLTTIDAIPVTTPTRTLIDLGGVVEERDVVRALDDAVRRKLTSVEVLERELERWGNRRRGSGVVRRAAARRRDGPTTESALETEFDELIHRSGLPTPSRQWVVRRADGEFVARVDFAYPAARLVIEIQSLRFHAGPDEWRAWMSREAELVAVGWRVLQVTARDIRARPEQLVQRLRTALDHGPASLTPECAGERRNQ
jgi:very-short-patch-repair endonuclease